MGKYFFLRGKILTKERISSQIFVAIVCLLGIGIEGIAATTFNWTGDGDQVSWEDIANWNPSSGFPSTIFGDTAVFSDPGFTAGAFPTSLGSQDGAKNITFNGNQAPFTVGSTGNTLLLSDTSAGILSTIDCTGATGLCTFDCALQFTNDLDINFTFSQSLTFSGPLQNNGPPSSALLIQLGSGTVTLNANNQFVSGTSGTAISASSTVLNVGALGALGDVGGGGALSSLSMNNAILQIGINSFATGVPITLQIFETVDTQTYNASLSGIIGGVGSLNKIGTGTLTLNNASNSFSGGTNVNVGTLNISHNGDLGAPAGLLTLSSGTTLQAGASFNLLVARTMTLVGGTATIDTNSFSPTIACNIGGAGSLAKINAGTLFLTDTNTYALTTVSGGTLNIGADANLGTGSLTLNGGTTLQAGGSFSLAAGRSVILGGSASIDSNSFNPTIAGPISGSGSLTKINSGILTLTSGTNSYGGGTIISGGTLALSAAGILSSSGTVQANAIFDISQVTASSAIGPLSGSGTVNLGSKALTVNSSSASTFSGVIADGGIGGGTGGTFFKAGPDVLTLTGVNTFSGGTTVTAGTLALSGAGALLSSGPLQVAGTFDISQVTASTAIGSLTGSGSIALGSKTLDVNNSGSTTFSGVIADGGIGSGTGGSLALNTGTLILSGLNTYTGSTTVNGSSTLRAGVATTSNNGAFGNKSAVSIASGATLDLNNFNTTIGSLSGPALSSVTLGTGVLTINGNNQIFAGIISGPGANGVVLQSGVQVFSGINTYGNGVNGTTIAGGTLSISQDANLGAIAAPLSIGTGTLLITGSGLTSARTVSLTGSAIVDTQGSGNSSVLSGVISGSGSLTKQGSGTLTLSGLNTYGSLSQGTIIRAGTLSVTSDNNLGSTVPIAPLTIDNGTLALTSAGFSSARPITLTASAIVDTQAAGNFTLSGNITGSGSLTKEGAGTLILLGSNLYGTALSIGTIVNAGILEGNVSSLQGNINTAVGTAVIFDQPNPGGTYSGQIIGFGSLTKTGLGTVILSGANTYTGGTTISQGILEGTTASLQGNIDITAAAGTLSFNQSGSGTYAGSLSGVVNSSLLIQGGGVYTFTGDSSSFLGSTTVSGSSLIVNGSLSGSPLTVDSGASVSGTGTVGPLTNNGQTIPGSLTSGTLTVSGNAQFNPGGVFVTNLSPLTTNLLHVTGTSTLGGTIDVHPSSGFYGISESYTIMTAGSVAGQFTTISVTDPNFFYQLSYFPTYVELVLTAVRPFRDFPCGNFNECAVAHNLDLLNENGLLPPDMVAAIDSLAGQSTDAINDALDQMHPAALSAFAEVQTELGGQLLSLLHRKKTLRCGCSQPNRLWVEPFGNWLEEKKQGMEIGFHATTRGVAFGYDHQFLDCWTLGIGGACNTTDLKWSLDRGHAYIDGIYGAIYSDLVLSNFYLGGSVYAGKDWYAAVRQLKFTIVDSQAKSHSDGFDMAGQLTAAYFFGTPSCLLYPYATVDYLYLQNSHFSENGAGSFDLQAGSYTSSNLRTEAGGAWQFIDRNRDETICISPLISIGYVLELPLHRDEYQATFAGQTIPFRTKGWDMAWQLLNLRFGLAITYRCFTLDSQYIADISPAGDSPFFNQRANFRLSWFF